MNQYLTIFSNRRMLTILCLSFASGLPLALSSASLQAWYTDAGVNIVSIGFLSLVGIPYVFKFLWAPLLDGIKLPWLGRRRGWMAASQVILVLVLFLMSFCNPSQHATVLASLALLLAFISATQDIAFDAFRTESLHAHERGLGSAMTTAGYRAAMLVSGGIALILAGIWGWAVTYRVMAVLMSLNLFVTYIADEPDTGTAVKTNLRAAMLDSIVEFLARPYALALLALIVLYKFTDAFAISLLSTFLLRETGFSLIEVGAIYKTVSILATIVGAMIGGLAMLRIGLFRALLYFGVLQALSNLVFYLLAISGKNYGLLVTAVFLENFCGGLATCALVALLMALCDTRYTATQFALLSALSAVGRTFIGPIAALTVQALGWANFFIISTLTAIPGLLLLGWLRAIIHAYDCNNVLTPYVGSQPMQEVVSD